MVDFQKQTSLDADAVLHLITTDIERLHNRVKDGYEIEAKINEVDVNIAEWTIGGETLLHRAVEAQNLKALEELIMKIKTDNMTSVINQRDRRQRTPLTCAMPGRGLDSDVHKIESDPILLLTLL